MSGFSKFLETITFHITPQYVQYIVLAVYILAVCGVVAVVVVVPIVMRKRRIYHYRRSLVVRDVCGNILSNKLLFYTTQHLEDLSTSVFRHLDYAERYQRMSGDEMQLFIINLNYPQLRPPQAAFLLGYQLSRMRKDEMRVFGRLISACGCGDADRFIQHTTQLKICIEPLKSGWNMLECIAQLVRYKRWRVLIGLILSLDEDEAEEVSALMIVDQGYSLSEFLARELPRRYCFSKLLAAWASYLRYPHDRLREESTALFLSFMESSFSETQLLMALTTTLNYYFEQMTQFVQYMTEKPIYTLIYNYFRRNKLDLLAYYLAAHFAVNNKRGTASFLSSQRVEDCYMIASHIAGDGVFVNEVEKVAELDKTRIHIKGYWAQFIEGCKQVK